MSLCLYVSVFVCVCVYVCVFVVHSETKCHIHFPDSNRGGHGGGGGAGGGGGEKSSQVSITGQAENVELARRKIRVSNPT